MLDGAFAARITAVGGSSRSHYCRNQAENASLIRHAGTRLSHQEEGNSGDFFLVKQPQNRSRKSWVVWEEGGKYPDLTVELLSDSTANTDRTLKKALYQVSVPHARVFLAFSYATSLLKSNSFYPLTKQQRV